MAAKKMKEDARRATLIAKHFEAIINLRDTINGHYLIIQNLLQDDGQLPYEVAYIEEMRVTQKTILRLETRQALNAWTDYAQARKEEV